MKPLFLLTLAPWLVSVSLMLLGTSLSIAQFRRRLFRKNLPCPPISVVKPLKGVQSGLEENLASFFRLEYPHFEIIFSAVDPQDPAIAVVKSLMRQFPEVSAQILVQETKIGANPKMNNIALSVEQARHDLILINDSTIRVSSDYLSQMRPHLQDKNGVVTAIVAGINARKLGGHLETLHLNTFCARGMLLANFFGKSCVLGKSMLIRKSTLDRFGGIQVLAQYLAEDFITAQAMFHLGLKIATLHVPVTQNIGEYSFKEFWLRHVRWGRMRKCHAPIVFATELLGSATIASLLGAFVLVNFLAVAFFPAFLFHLFLWMGLDFITIKALRGKIEGFTVLAWMIREFLLLPLWFDVLRDNKILWQGHRLRLQPGGLVETCP